MKKTNKKGFTIVELVIVIAVIAVLAAVLIPTFSGIIKTARLSSDKQAVNQMGEHVAIALAEKDIASLDELVDVLAAAGYNAEDSLVPVSTNHGFFWSWDEKVLFLAKVDENDLNKPLEVVFPEDSEKLIASGARYDSLRGTYKYVDIVANDAATLEQALLAGNEKITLQGDLKLSQEITLPAGSDVEIDLNGHKITTEQVTGRSKYLNVGTGTTLTVKNGEFNARGIQVYNGAKLVIAEDANLTVNNVDSNGGAAVWIYAGGEVEINGGVFTAMNGQKQGNEQVGYAANPGVISNEGKLTINGGTFKSAETICYLVSNRGGEMIINGGTFEGTHGIIAVTAGTVTINGGTFKLNPYNDGSYDGNVVWVSNGTVVVNGGSFARADGKNTSIFTGNVVDNR